MITYNSPVLKTEIERQNELQELNKTWTPADKVFLRAESEAWILVGHPGLVPGMKEIDTNKQEIDAIICATRPK